MISTWAPCELSCAVCVHISFFIAIQNRIKNEFRSPSTTETLSSIVQTDLRKVLLNKFHFNNPIACTNTICTVSHRPITSWLTSNGLVQLPLCKEDWGAISATNRGYRSGWLPRDSEEWKKAVLVGYSVTKVLPCTNWTKKRTVEGAEKTICDTLRWAGLQWDEGKSPYLRILLLFNQWLGPEIGGPYGPYKQVPSRSAPTWFAINVKYSIVWAKRAPPTACPYAGASMSLL